MKKRLLIVEDHDDLRKVVRVFFEDEGFEVFETATVDEALRLCAHEQPHVMILDVYLDGEYGLDIAGKIAQDKTYYGNPKIIAVSGTLGGEMVRSCDFHIKNNIDIFIKKPFDFDVLIQKVHELLQDV